jgi:hypothetical protein
MLSPHTDGNPGGDRWLISLRVANISQRIKICLHLNMYNFYFQLYLNKAEE